MYFLWYDTVSTNGITTVSATLAIPERNEALKSEA